MKTIHLVMGARPNFVKVAPLYRALVTRDGVRPLLVYTGQHTDAAMAWDLFEDLQLPAPHIQLTTTGDTHASRTASIMVEYEKVCLAAAPDFVIVTGDVNSSLAACLVAKKLGIAVGHVESGLRCGDRTMPEELNRVVIDSIADLLWTPSQDASQNLRAEGRVQGVQLVGNILIDSLLQMRQRETTPVPPGDYGLVTLHRPTNVDDEARLLAIWTELQTLSQLIKLIFPVHPRTKARMQASGLWSEAQKQSGVQLMAPQPYSAFVNLLQKARLVITDSGGIQEEAAVLGVPCLTLRKSTERPITLQDESNVLVELDDLCAQTQRALRSVRGAPLPIPLWDGAAAERIADHLDAFLRR